MNATGMQVMVEWPGRCEVCKGPIIDWPDAGLHAGRWVHKTCFQESRRVAIERGADLQPLRSPEERGRLLEWPMLAFLLMFHFGLGGAVAGWLLLTQHRSESAGIFLVAIGIIVPLIGVGGVAVNVISRRRIEMVRQALEVAGGWRPGR